jgi:hypothetical protein
MDTEDDDGDGAMALQETYSFTDGNNTVHSFLDSSVVYKCEGGVHSTSQKLYKPINIFLLEIFALNASIFYAISCAASLLKKLYAPHS